MNPTEKSKLRLTRVEFVNNLEATDILDYLLEDGILTENDCELISNSKTRKERAQLLLAMLPKRGPNAYGSFQRALTLGKYNFLQEKLAAICIDDIKDNKPLNLTDESRKANDLRFFEEIISSCRNEIFKIILKQHAFLLADNVEPCDLIDLFYQEHLISDDELELVKIGSTRKERCLTFLMYISHSLSENVVSTLILSLKKKYKYISEMIQKTSETMSSQNVYRDENRNIQRNNVNLTNAEETRIPTQNTELSTETYEKVLCRTEVSLTDPKQQVENNLSTYPILHSKLEESTAPENTLVETQTFLKGTHVSMGLCENEKCSGLSKLEAKCENLPVEHSNSSFVDSNCKSNSDICCKSIVLKSSVNFEENALSDIFDETKETCKVTTNDTVADSAALTIRPQAVRFDNVHTNESTAKPVLKTLISTDSESDIDIPRKSRRKNKNPKRLMETTDNLLEKDLISNKKVNSGTSKEFSKRTMSCTNKKSENKCRTNSLTDDNDDDAEQYPSFRSDDSTQSYRQNTNRHSIMNYQPAERNPHLAGKHLVVTFNYLSTLINQGSFDKFELFSSNLQRKYAKDPDMTCLLGYLHASRDLFKTDFDSAKRHIDNAFEIVPKTSNPKYFTLELFTSKTRMYISQKKLEKLENTLDDAKMIIETDPLGCTGRAAGWLYMNDARNCTAQIGLLNFRNHNAISSYTKLHKRAKESFQKALTNFQRDGGKDGPFGFGYALCRLAILLLQCGDNGRTMDILLPPEEDIKLAGGHLQSLEDSEIAIPKILEMHFVLAKCDYQFRRKNTTRALEYAELAYKIASELKLLEFTEHAHNRCKFLRTKTPMVIDDVSEEEFTSILFSEASDNPTD